MCKLTEIPKSITVFIIVEVFDDEEPRIFKWSIERCTKVIEYFSIIDF